MSAAGYQGFQFEYGVLLDFSLLILSLNEFYKLNFLPFQDELKD